MISDDAEKAMANGVKTCLGTVRASLDMIAQAVTTPTRPTRKFGRAQPSRCCNTSSIRYASAISISGYGRVATEPARRHS
jgi:hypothetical protein